MPPSITFTDPDVGEAEAEAARDLVLSGWISMGDATAQLENEIAERLGAADVVLVSSGTAALHLAMLAMGIGPGDEVLVPSMSFVATASTVAMAGATPRFVDIAALHDPTLDPERVSEAIRVRPKAVVVTHLAGFPAQVEALTAVAEDAGIGLVEDCAHAPVVEYMGRMLGTFGRFGCLSFHTTKSISMGEGGAVVCRDSTDASRIRLLRNHGLQRDDAVFQYDVVAEGFNYRPSEIAAAVGRVQLARLREDRTRRAALRALYGGHLADTPSIMLPFQGRETDSAHHLMPVVLPPHVDRDSVRRRLRAAGIESGVHYPPIHELTQYRQAPREWLGASVAYGRRHLTLPLHARLTADDVGRVTEALIEAVGFEAGSRR